MVFYIPILTIFLIGFAVATTDFQCWNFKSTNELRERYLAPINDIRRQIAEGNAAPNRHQDQDAYKLSWDCALEQQAEKAVETCDENTPGPSGVSQLIRRVPVTTCDTVGLLSSTTSDFWNVGDNSGANTQNSMLDNQNLHSFATLAHGKATRIGCAQRNCNEDLYVACVVNTVAAPSAVENPSTSFLTSTATSTTTTPSTTTVTTSNPTTPAPTSVTFTMAKSSDDHSYSYCPNNNISTDEVRGMFLNLHNQFRSSLALGSVTNGRTGRLARKASRMLRLKYDCNAERTAYNSAMRCMDVDSPQSMHPGLVENRYVIHDTGLDYMTTARRAANHWWNEMVTYGVPQGNNVFHLGLAIPHFAKMAWDTHERIGCSIFKCPAFIHAVCHYGPGGTLPGRRIYKMGPTCSECNKINASKCVDGLCVFSKNGLHQIRKPSFHDPSKQN